MEEKKIDSETKRKDNMSNTPKYLYEQSANDAKKQFIDVRSYTTIDLPPYYKFETLLLFLSDAIGNSEIDEVTKNNPKFRQKDDVCYNFIVSKNSDLAYRRLSLIHPVLYLCLVNTITNEQNWRKIQQRLSEFYTENTNIVCCSKLTVLEDKKTNSGQNINQWIDEFENECIIRCMDYDYMYITDIQDCYPSIYTHSIVWAIHGRPDSKKHINSQLGDRIDQTICAMQSNQTNGIPQGSRLMDFIAELVLGYVDFELSTRLEKENIGKYNILRYRDDYRIMTKSETDAKKIIRHLNEVLMVMNLHLSANKTHLSTAPLYESVKPDKLYWFDNGNQLHLFRNKLGGFDVYNKSTLKTVLLSIYKLNRQYPNSGSVLKALTETGTFVSKILHNQKNVKLDNNEIKLYVSILIRIALESVKAFPIVMGIIRPLVEQLPQEQQVTIFCKIDQLLKENAQYEYFEVWFKRIVKEETDIEFKSKLIPSKQEAWENKRIWNSSWIKAEVPQIIEVMEQNPIFDKDIYDKISPRIKASEINPFCAY